MIKWSCINNININDKIWKEKKYLNEWMNEMKCMGDQKEEEEEEMVRLNWRIEEEKWGFYKDRKKIIIIE